MLISFRKRNLISLIGIIDTTVGKEKDLEVIESIGMSTGKKENPAERDQGSIKEVDPILVDFLTRVINKRRKRSRR